jgi:hypothetical protein
LDQCCKFARQNYRKLKRKKKLYPWQITSEEVNNAEKHYKFFLDSNLKKHRKDMSRHRSASVNEILVYFFRINIIELFRKIIEIVDIYAFYELLGL